MSQITPANAYELIWCHDVRQALRFLQAVFPDAATTLHETGRYAELRVDGHVLALAAIDIAQRSTPRSIRERPIQVVAQVARHLNERAAQAGAVVVGKTIVGPGDLKVSLA